MSRMQHHPDAIQRSNHVDLPGTRWRHLPQLLLTSALGAASAAMAWSEPGLWRPLGYGLVALVCCLGALHVLHLIATSRRAIRIRPEGIAERGGAAIPWRMLTEAESGRDTDEAWDMRVLLILSSDGRAWARANDVRLKDVHRPLRARGIEVPVLRGCNHQETATC